MQFITTDQRIAVENFEIGLIYTVTFTSGSFFLGACIGIGANYVMFQRTAPELIFSLTMATAADVASIDPLGNDIGKILEYTGSVPVSIKTNGSPILDYIISGNTLPGTGERTKNLFDSSVSETSRYLNSEGNTITSSAFNISDYIPCDAETTYTVENVNTDSVTPSVCFYSPQKDFLSGVNYNRASGITFDTPVDCAYLKVSYRKSMAAQAMLNLGSTALPYEPYGYIIPIISGGTITNIYIGTNPLRKSLDDTAVDELSSNGKLTQRVDTDGSVLPNPIISYIDTPTIPTTDGLNIFDIDTTVKPSEVYLKYFSPLL